MKKQQYSDETKRKAVLAMESSSPSEAAEKFGIPRSMLYVWRKNIRELGSPGKRSSRGQKELRAKRGELPTDVAADALIYLRHAEQAIVRGLREGRLKRPDPAHLYALLALQALQGDRS